MLQKNVNSLSRLFHTCLHCQVNFMNSCTLNTFKYHMIWASTGFGSSKGLLCFWVKIIRFPLFILESGPVHIIPPEIPTFFWKVTIHWIIQWNLGQTGGLCFPGHNSRYKNMFYSGPWPDSPIGWLWDLMAPVITNLTWFCFSVTFWSN